MVFNGIRILTLILLCSSMGAAQIQMTMRRDATGGGGGPSNGLLTSLDAVWLYDEGSGSSAVDEINGLTFTFYNSPTWTSGKIDGGMSFDGVDDYAISTSTTLLQYDADQESFSFNMWMKTDNFNPGNNNPYIQYKWTGVTNQDYCLILLYIHSGNELRWYVYTPTFFFVTLDNDVYNFENDAWHMFTFVRDDPNDKMQIYLDGTLVVDETRAITAFTPVGTTGLQTPSNASSRYVHMEISQLAFWNKKLDATDVSNLYNSGSGLSYSLWD